jgi:hypothetical protein
MFKNVKPERISSTGTHACTIAQFPHCDPRVLHAPHECAYCDKHSDWQDLRIVWGIAFTGYTPEGTELPCPADHARGDKHKDWGGNQAQQEIWNGVSPKDCPFPDCTIGGSHQHFLDGSAQRSKKNCL